VKREDADQRIAALDARLAKVELAYFKWNQDLEMQRKQLLEGDMDWWKASEVVHQRRVRTVQEGKSPVDFNDLKSLLTEICSVYLRAREEAREAIRAMFDDKPSLLAYLHSYIAHTTQRLAETKDQDWLRLGLAAASICDRRVDWRDLMICLGDLYMTAKETGLRPGYQFSAVARISNPSRKYKESSTRELLVNFRKSAYLRTLQHE